MSATHDQPDTILARCVETVSNIVRLATLCLLIVLTDSF